MLEWQMADLVHRLSKLSPGLREIIMPDLGSSAKPRARLRDAQDPWRETDLQLDC